MFAISTPIDEQYSGDGIAARGVAYGIPTIRVDGNDIFAVYLATRTARELILGEQGPALIEAITYRVADHSTSDCAQLYQTEQETAKLHELLTEISCPIKRLESYLINRGLVTKDYIPSLRKKARSEATDALSQATQALLPETDNLFEDVYDKLPTSLVQQRQQLRDHLAKYPLLYELEKFKIRK